MDWKKAATVGGFVALFAVAGGLGVAYAMEKTSYTPASSDDDDDDDCPTVTSYTLTDSACPTDYTVRVEGIPNFCTTEWTSDCGADCARVKCEDAGGTFYYTSGSACTPDADDVGYNCLMPLGDDGVEVACLLTSS